MSSILDACSMVTDGTHYTPQDVGSGIPFLTVKDVSGAGLDFKNCSKISESDFETARVGSSTPMYGDVLFSKDGTVGKVHVVETHEPFAVLSSLAILRPNPKKSDSRYLGHALKSPFILDQALKKKTGSAIRRIILSDLKQVQIPLPPLPEQRRIAAILDKAEELVVKRRQALALLDQLPKSLFQEYFSPTDQWEAAPLGDVVRQGTIVTYGIVQAGEEFPGGVPYIRTGDIVDGIISESKLRRTNPEIARKFQRSRVEAGDIVMSIRATVGTVARVPTSLDGANLTQGTARIAPGAKTDPTYLINYFRSDNAQRWIESQVKGATFREITLNRLREMPVPVPPIDRQMQYKEVIESLSRVQNFVIAHLELSEASFNSLQHSFFSRSHQ